MLRCAAFVGPGLEAPVAVLLEGGRGGPVVEIYYPRPVAAAGSGLGPYTLREVLPLAAARLTSGPTGARQASPPGVMHGGNVILWAEHNGLAVEFTRLAATAGEPEDAPGTVAGAAGGSGGGAAALFARARQGATKVRLRVAPAGGGAGLDMEASRWGYLVEEVEAEPGQPDVAAGDCIISIGGQALHGLDEETMEWRFGRNFADGVELAIVPAGQMGPVLAAEKAANSGEGAAPKAIDAKAAATAPKTHSARVRHRRIL